MGIVGYFLLEGIATDTKPAVSSLGKEFPSYLSENSAVKYRSIRGDIYKAPHDANNYPLLAIVDNEFYVREIRTTSD